MTDPVQTVARFFRARDDRNYHTLAALLTEDGVWSRQGVELRNETNINAAMATRSPTRQIHHLLTNLSAEPIGENEVSVTGYMLVVRHDGSRPTDGPYLPDGIENIRTMRARLRRSPEGWHIAHLGSDALSFARRVA